MESVASDGQATFVYAVGDGPEWKIKPAWSRETGPITDGTLSFTLRGGAARVRYVLTPDGRLEGAFETDRTGASVVLRRVEPASRDALAALVAGEKYRVEPEQIFIPVKTGAGADVRLEATATGWSTSSPCGGTTSIASSSRWAFDPPGPARAREVFRHTRHSPAG